MKKFASIILCFVIATTCCFASTGCASFKIDKVSYYNAVVAKVGESKITRHQLLSAYNSYGKSKYLSDSDNDEQKAIKKTLEHLEQQEALYLYALDDLDKYGISANQMYNLFYDLFDSVDSDFSTLKSEAYAILNITLKEDESSEDESEDDEEDSISTTPYTVQAYEYKKRATVETKSVDGETKTVIKYIIEPIEKTDGTDSESEGHKLHSLLAYLDESATPEKSVVLEIKDSYFKYLKDSIKAELEENAENYNEDMVERAYNKLRELLATNLINYEYYLRDENGNAYNKVSEDLYTRYFTRVYESKLKSCYISNIKTEYFRDLELDTDKLVEKYYELVKADYAAYSDDESAYLTKLAGLKNAGDTLFYHLDISTHTSNDTNTDETDNDESGETDTDSTETTFVDQKVGYFLHTLIKFTGSVSDKTGEAYIANNLKTGETDIDKYNSSMAELINNMKVNYRDENGNFARDNDGKLLTVSFAEVLADYDNVTDLESFKAFMFKYSKDDSTLKSSTPYVTSSKVNSNTPYVVGGNQDGKVIGSWEQGFSDEAIDMLYNDRLMSEKITTTDDKIASTDVPKLCITTYGIHFLYYVGDVNKYDIPYSSENDNVYIEQTDRDAQPEKVNLYTKLLNEATKETYFDKMFDLVYMPASGSSEVYAETNDYETYEKDLYTMIFNSKFSKSEYKDIINSTKTNID